MNWFLIYIYHMRATGVKGLWQYRDYIEGIDQRDIEYLYRYERGIYPYGN